MVTFVKRRKLYVEKKCARLQRGIVSGYSPIREGLVVGGVDGGVGWWRVEIRLV